MSQSPSSKSAAPGTSAPLLIVISAPSGGGKTTLCEELLKVHPNVTRAITCTTRPPRPRERDGVDYHFLGAATFLKRVQAGHFLEHATVHGHSYGVLKSELLDKLHAGKDVLLNVDVQGAATICGKADGDEELRRALVTVFLTPATPSELEQRLRKRGTDSPEVIEKRLGVARHEIAHWKRFQYLIISTTVPEDLRRMRAIVDAEKMRQFRATGPQCE